MRGGGLTGSRPDPDSASSWPHREKAKELHEWIHQLESEKFDLMEKLKRQKYEVREGGRGGLSPLGGAGSIQPRGGALAGSGGGRGWPSWVITGSPPPVCRLTSFTTASAMPRNCE